MGKDPNSPKIVSISLNRKAVIKNVDPDPEENDRFRLKGSKVLRIEELE